MPKLPNDAYEKLRKVEEHDVVGEEFNLINGVKDRLKQMKVSYETEKRIGLYTVDIYLPEKKIAIEVDGPSHFICPTLEYNGASSAKARYLN